MGGVEAQLESDEQRLLQSEVDIQEAERQIEHVQQEQRTTEDALAADLDAALEAALEAALTADVAAAASAENPQPLFFFGAGSAGAGSAGAAASAASLPSPPLP